MNSVKNKIVVLGLVVLCLAVSMLTTPALSMQSGELEGGERGEGMYHCLPEDAEGAAYHQVPAGVQAVEPQIIEIADSISFAFGEENRTMLLQNYAPRVVARAFAQLQEDADCQALMAARAQELVQSDGEFERLERPVIEKLLVALMQEQKRLNSAKRKQAGWYCKTDYVVLALSLGMLGLIAGAGAMGFRSC